MEMLTPTRSNQSRKVYGKRDGSAFETEPSRQEKYRRRG